MMHSIALDSSLGAADQAQQLLQPQHSGEQQASHNEDTQFQPLHPAPSLFHGHHGAYAASGSASAAGSGQQQQQNGQDQMLSQNEKHLLPSPRGGAERSVSISVLRHYQ